MNGEWVERLVARIRATSEHHAPPLFVAIDGRSGAGKSTLAAAVAARVGATLIDGDDFYGGGTAGEWDAMRPAERVEHCIDWRRQRAVLETLADGEPATWYPYDWERNDGSREVRPVVRPAADVVILEGVYSARPQLADLFALTVLLIVDDDVRQELVRRREGEQYQAEWEQRWASAEEHYFATVNLPECYDMILSQC